MTPLSHTLYAVALFSALVCLLFWVKRRRRMSYMVKRALAGMVGQTSVCGGLQPDKLPERD
jgi:hypothetical protein